MDRRRRHRRSNNLKGFVVLAVTLVIVAGGLFVIWHSFKGEAQPTDRLAESSAESSIENTGSTANSSSSVSEPEVSASSTAESTEDAGQTVQLDSSALLANAGTVSYEVYYFNSGKTISSHNSARMISASVIKVFIMEYVYLQASRNTLSLDDYVQGVPMSSLVDTMIQQSDNNAANALIDHFGMDTLNHFFAEYGYSDTELQRRMLDDTARSQGLDNYTSLNDVMNFLKKVYQNKDQYLYSKMLEIMQGQQIGTKIRNKIPPGTPVANKTGELGDVENDIGIVLTDKDPFAVAVLTNGVTATGNIRGAIADFAYNAYELGN